MYALNILKEAFVEWWNAEPLSAGAAAAYYAVFSIPSALILVITLAGIFLNPNVVQVTVVAHIKTIIGTQAATLMNATLDQLRIAKGGYLGLISIFAIVFASIGVFSQLQSTLNKMWKVENIRLSGMWHVAEQQLLALLIVILLGSLLTVSFVIGIFWAIAGAHIVARYPTNGWILSFVSEAQFWIIVCGSFYILYTYLPSVRVFRRAALVGSIVGTLLFGIGRYLITLYLTYGSSATTYGTASALVIIMLWAYYSSQMFFFGAAVTSVIDQRLRKA